MGEADKRGRRSPVEIPGSEHVLDADCVIKAFGFQPSPADWLEESGVSLTERGLIIAPETGDLPFQTSSLNIFAGGDAVRGSDLVVTAIAEGRAAAESILEYLGV